MPGELIITAPERTRMDRTKALEALTAAGIASAATPPGVTPAAAPAPVTRTGQEVEAGGDVARLLVAPVHLSYRTTVGGDSVLVYPRANVGDVVLLSAREAARLDALGATVDPDTDLAELAEQQDDGLATDEQLATMNATELVAYVGQHPEDRERVRALEETRDKPRKTVLAATEPTPDADGEAEIIAAGGTGEDPDDADGFIPEDDTGDGTGLGV